MLIKKTITTFHRLLRPLKTSIALIAIGSAPLLAPTLSSATTTKRTLCVYDVAGANGDIFNISKDYQLAMLKHHVDFDLKPYTNDQVALADFKSGQCDAAMLPGISIREFNPFSGSLEAVGAMPTREHMELAFRTLTKAKARPLLTNGPFEIAGLLPAGTVYLFVNDRSINTVPELSGKRIAVIEHDPAQPELVDIVGGSTVPAGLTNFASLFNNGSVDVCPAPAAAYGALELYKGLEPKGGIIDIPLGQLTFQLVTHKKQFSADFLQTSRDYLFSQFPRMMTLVEKARKDIDPKYWIEIPTADLAHYQELLRQARISMRDKNILAPKALTVMRKVRCSVDSTLAECTAADRE